ncbi:uncharacterized protein DC041_0010822 [Schistosoma bovis]|uniref:MORN repeat-containing protein 3 n=1 Tax=Schistosoma bovis TaxID=6184 RepID=A0A430Q535_SCHBO|nr:uncharacterized protein DC041_0010822 [Schistosoma bovis]
MSTTSRLKNVNSRHKEIDFKADKNGLRNTVFSVNGDKYIGEWKHNKRHGTKPIFNRIMGYGNNWYSDNKIYEGEWYDGKRSGWGRMYYPDGSIYEGQWFNDKRHGDGMLRLANENRFEGQWLNDKKNGVGKYFFLNTGQLMEGIWCDDVPKSSQILDLGRQVAKSPTESEIPETKSAEPTLILYDSYYKTRRDKPFKLIILCFY